MRLKLILVTLVGISLFIFGFHPDKLPYLRHDARYSDAVLAHWPNALYLRESLLENGEFPLWRETTMAGQPFAANPLNKTAYPFQWLVVLLTPALHLNVLMLFHLFIAGSGMWVWARSLGLRVEAVAISAFAYVLAPRLIGHMGAGHLDVFYAMAWWPWLMWAARQMVWHSGGKAVPAMTLGLLSALLFLADVRVSLFAFGTVAVYALIELYRKNAWKSIGWYVIVAIIFLALTLSLIVPLVLWRPYMSRAGLSPADAGVLALEAVHFLGLVLPAHRPSIETLTYLGLPVLALAGIAIASFPKPVRIGLIIALCLVALYAMGANAPVWSLLVRLVPGLLWFRVPSKAWLILALLLPLLAGYGAQWLLEQAYTGRRFRRLELALVIGTAVSVASGFFALFILKLPSTMGASALVGGLLVGGTLLLILNRRIQHQRVPLLLIFLIFLDLVWTDYHWVDWRGEDIWLEPGRPIAERLVAANADRIYSPTYSLEQQVAEVYDLRLFGGVDPFQLAGIVRAVSQGSGVPSLKYDPVLPSLGGAESDADVASANKNAVMDVETLTDWKVSHVVAAYPIDHPRLTLLDTVNGVYIYNNLDYQAAQQLPTIPDWPDGWPDLPDPATVTRFNQITVVVSIVSGVSFLVCVIILFLFRFRLGARRD